MVAGSTIGPPPIPFIAGISIPLHHPTHSQAHGGRDDGPSGAAVTTTMQGFSRMAAVTMAGGTGGGAGRVLVPLLKPEALARFVAHRRRNGPVCLLGLDVGGSK